MLIRLLASEEITVFVSREIFSSHEKHFMMIIYICVFIRTHTHTHTKKEREREREIKRKRERIQRKEKMV